MPIVLPIVAFAVTMTLGVPIAFCLGLGGLTFFVQRCGVLPKLIEFANNLVGHLRGGLGYVVVLTSMLFAGVTGVALAECAAIGAMVGPSMVRQGYPGGFVSAVVAGSAVMGPIIPPSVATLIYAYVYGGGISVGKLFLMGVVPGVLVGLALMGLVWLVSWRRGFPVSSHRFSPRAVWGSLRGALLGLMVVLRQNSGGRASGRLLHERVRRALPLHRVSCRLPHGPRDRSAARGPPGRDGGSGQGARRPRHRDAARLPLLRRVGAGRDRRDP